MALKLSAYVLSIFPSHFIPSLGCNLTAWYKSAVRLSLEV
jgi:hypothetical protein